MKHYQVHLVNSKGAKNEVLTFSLPEKATVLDLKTEYSENDVYSVDQFRLTYKTDSDKIGEHSHFK